MGRQVLVAQGIALKQIVVTGIDEVTVAAGTFKAFTVQVKSAEGDPETQTLWIASDTRRAVKIVSTQPNGAVLTSESTK